jgi:hypothetical protein
MAQSQEKDLPERQPPIGGETVAFFDLADWLAHTSDPAEQQRLKEELARMTFGEPEVARAARSPLR